MSYIAVAERKDAHSKVMFNDRPPPPPCRKNGLRGACRAQGVRHLGQIGHFRCRLAPKSAFYAPAGSKASGRAAGTDTEGPDAMSSEPGRGRGGGGTIAGAGKRRAGGRAGSRSEWRLFWEKEGSECRERRAAKGGRQERREKGALSRQSPSAVGSPRSGVSRHPPPPLPGTPPLPLLQILVNVPGD